MKTKTILIMMSLPFLLIVFYCCQEKETIVPIDRTLPTIKILGVNDIENFSATVGGEILSNGGTEVTTVGYCLSESPNPSLKTNTIINGGKDKKFIINLQNLKGNTTYYIRIYATNAAGTAYSEVISFITPTQFSETITDVDGNVYGVIQIGTIKVMAQDLKTKKFRNGDIIPNITDDQAWSSLKTSGIFVRSTTFYNWYAVNDSRNIAPVGWHVPTIEEAYNIFLNPSINYILNTGKIDGLKGIWNDNAVLNLGLVILNVTGAYWSCSSAELPNSANSIPLDDGGYVAWGATKGYENNGWASYGGYSHDASTAPPKKSVWNIPNLKQTGLPVRCIKDN